MIEVGQHRNLFDTSTMMTATFHPLKDEWYITAYENQQCYFIVITDNVCTIVEECTPEVAQDKFDEATKKANL